MVNFWFNHFNIFAGEGLERIWIGNYEEQAIRPYALGRFRDLLFAVAKHPAMLVYLDNTQNTASARTGADRLNENFAREVMELHTLGAEGGYTQDGCRDPGAGVYRVAGQSARIRTSFPRSPRYLRAPATITAPSSFLAAN